MKSIKKKRINASNIYVLKEKEIEKRINTLTKKKKKKTFRKKKLLDR